MKYVPSIAFDEMSGSAKGNVEMRLLLSEVASYGYVLAAIGPYDEADVMAQWRGVLKSAYPETKGEVVMANGEKILPLTAEEKKARQEQEAKQRAEAAKQAKKNKKQAAPAVMQFPTYPKMLLEVLNWLTDQNAAQGSEYYHCLASSWSPQSSLCQVPQIRHHR